MAIVRYSEMNWALMVTFCLSLGRLEGVSRA